VKSPKEEYPKVYLYRRVVQAKLFIESNYRNKTDLDLVSDEACFSKFHFLRLFKKVYGKTPHQFLVEVRIEKAKELLKQNVAVKDVCEAVGFESLGTFTSLFKRRVGETPAKFQQRELRLQSEIVERPLVHIPGCFAESKGWK
jgi:AraC-like DNA-binding protein